MLPLHQAQELTAALQAYYEATYSFRDRPLGQAFHGFLDHPEQGMYKGPYLSLKLPFVTSKGHERPPIEVWPKFAAYDHQRRACERLTTENGHTPQPTILTTGTGSGKTESFLYPLLNDCYRRREQPGIKAIVLYPMNALATDQAGRFAEAVYQDARLREANVRVGLLIGQGPGETKDRPTSMGKDHVIEDRDTIVQHPPDILLTNFKMLDYALMRAFYHNLWKHNLGHPERLRFLVLDELHTYDGAQGSDVANLLRRLKLKLGIERGHLCPVGTSATVGDDADGAELLATYASRVFGETITEEAIIGETREAPEKFFASARLRLPPKLDAEQLKFREGDQYEDYIRRIIQQWGLEEDSDAQEVGDWLRTNTALESLARTCGRAPTSTEIVIREWCRDFDAVAALPTSARHALLNSLVALASYARVDGGRPLFNVQVQLWVRELSGITRLMADPPAFAWRNPGRQTETRPRAALPLWHCRECGGSGWLSFKGDNSEQFSQDVRKISEAFFRRDKNCWLLTNDRLDLQPIEEYQATGQLHLHLDPLTLAPVKDDLGQSVAVLAVRKYTEHRAQLDCPHCATAGSITYVGGRSTVIASVLTGQIMATDLDPTAEEKRKVLAFTNSVQDAAHQAGFLQARNYRFALRNVIYTTLQELRGKTDLNRLIDYLLISQRAVLNTQWPRQGERAFVSRFFPAGKLSRENPDNYQRDNHYAAEFMDELERAIGWELTAEMGLYHNRGRTLEKTQTAWVGFAAESVDRVVQQLKPWLRDNALGLFATQPEQLRYLVLGVLHRMRQRGGIDHPFLQKARTEKPDTWNLHWNRDGRHFLNPYFGGGPYPHPVATEKVHRSAQLLDSTHATKSANWYHLYYRRVLTEAPADPALVNDFYTELLRLLQEVGLVNRVEGQTVSNYCLAPQHVQVGADAGAVECEKCNAWLTLPRGDISLVGMPCLTYRCDGHYTPADRTDDYYRTVYRRGRAPRIYATDHTGLLARADREDKESDFRGRPNVDSLNALVATSTLEMGIDIGDLNVTINTDVPPQPANFLQRVGRAGRKSGSALIVNLAEGSKAHDLFYYEEPSEMMAGRVHTPGCFLSASEILKRHFLAFVLDTWTAEDPRQNVLAPRLIGLPLSRDRQRDPQWVPNQLASYIHQRGAELLRHFLTGYTTDGLDEAAVTELTTYVLDDRLRRRLLNCFDYVLQERDRLRNAAIGLRERLDGGQYGKTDPEYKRLSRTLAFLGKARRQIGERQTLEHLTNYGLLPNYAFPETGITMTGEIQQPGRDEDGQRTWDSQLVELTRSAKRGLRELAPGAEFYTQGWQLPVTGISPVDISEHEARFRFCPNCDHLELEAPVAPGRCPKCGDARIGAVEQVMSVVRPYEVKATARRDRAMIRDQNEDRKRRPERTSHHFDFTESTSLGAFALESIPFGVEYIRRVRHREVNFGWQTSAANAGDGRVEVNQHTVGRTGFITCRHCGHSTPEHPREQDHAVAAHAYHYPYCPQREVHYDSGQEGVFGNFFLYREVEAEVLKVLLPIQEFETESQIALFIAALNLGLRHYYGGNPSHIDIHGYQEHNQRTGRPDVYLILLDNIPGGTGYLGKLFTPAVITELLQLAYAVIRDCSCQQRGKDGCYHCVFSYETSHFHHQLSRREAERMLAHILSQAQSWQRYPGGLNNVGSTGRIEESELERRFVRLWRTLARQEPRKYDFTEVNQLGHVEYHLELTTEAGRYAYRLRPQVSLDRTDGVALPTRADFMLRLTGGEEAGRAITPEDLAAHRPIAVYLDGYQFHATAEQPRFTSDIERRVGIVNSGRYLSWTLTYDDVERAEQLIAGKVLLDNELSRAAAQRDRGLQASLAKQWNVSTRPEDWEDLGGFMHLLSLARQGLSAAAARKQVTGVLTALVRRPPKLFAEASVVAAIEGRVAPENLPEQQTRESWLWLTGLPGFTVSNFTAALFAKYGSGLSAFRLSVTPPEGDYDKASWYAFWRLFNVLQLLPHPQELVPWQCHVEGTGLPASAAIRYLAGEIPTSAPPNSTAPAAAPKSADLAYVLEAYDPEYHALVTVLVREHDRGSDTLDGSFGYPPDPAATLQAEAVLGNHEKRVVVGPLGEVDAKIFIRKGYRILALDAVQATDL